MTRAWDSQTKSAYGAVKRTLIGARGPSLHANVEGDTTLHDPEFARHVGTYFQRGEVVSLTVEVPQYKCGGTANASQQRRCGPVEVVQYDVDRKIDGTRSGALFARGAGSREDGTSPEPKQWFNNSTSSGEIYSSGLDVFFGLRFAFPRDSLDPPLYFVAYAEWLEEADRSGPQACGAGWQASSGFDSDPPAGVHVYQFTSVAKSGGEDHYVVYQRADEDSAWAPADDPWLGSFDASQWITVNQTTGKLWAVNKAPNRDDIDVWGITAKHASASPATVTPKTGTSVNTGFGTASVRHWGDLTIIRLSDDTLWLYQGTTLVEEIAHGLGFFGSWDFAFGWLVISDAGTALLHFFRVTEDGAEFHSSTGPAFVPVTMAGQDWCVAGTRHRVFLDHRAGTWRDGGRMTHARQAQLDDFDGPAVGDMGRFYALDGGLSPPVDGIRLLQVF